MSFLDFVGDLRSKGLSDKEIYEGFGMKSTEFRDRITIERTNLKLERIHMVRKLGETGNGPTAISKRLGIPEPTVRSYLKAGAEDKAESRLATSKMLMKEVDDKTWIDVGTGVETHLGISKENLRSAVGIAKEHGYEVHTFKAPQVGTGKDTEYKVLGPKGSTQLEALLQRDHLSQLSAFSIDNGKHWSKTHKPLSIDPSRVAISYEDTADGLVYVRPGVPDLNMGGNSYTQVRIKVGKDHYIKGMAVFNDKLPKGVDLLVASNKQDTGNKLDALKKLEDDPTLPFGSVVRNITSDTGTPKEKNISAINVVNEEKDWNKWSKSVATQVLSKQNPSLIEAQCKKTYDNKRKELDEILSYNNPTVRKKLLEEFSGDADSAAVHLNTVALTKDTTWHVILPMKSLKPTEVFAPNYPDGSQVVLIRYPHGGPFEIPELIVNNKNRESRKYIGTDAKAAVGIHPDVAERLSGADFDGDTVLVIPNNSRKLKSLPALEALKGFEPKNLYKMSDDQPGIRDMKDPKGKTGQIMGEASNLITDMTIRGASIDKIARAVQYSMVTIDAEKHHLDYKQAYKDFAIKALKDEFQVDPAYPTRRGASTLISRATATVRVPEFKPRPYQEGGPINKKTGELEYVPTGRTRVDKDGNVVEKTVEVKRLANTRDAHTLSTNTRPEQIYADHSNNLKALANEARLSMINTPNLVYSPSAKKTYATQVDSLVAKLTKAQMNSPRERQAQILANASIRAYKQANPTIEKGRLKKFSYKELEKARARTGAGKEKIYIDDDEWKAIQAGAISDSRLKAILANADMTRVKELATPRRKTLMTATNTTKAKQMLASGRYTRAEVASALGVSLSTLDNATA